MPPSGCYAITTRKFNLIHDHREWFADTQTLYNSVVGFYCGLYVELWGGRRSEPADGQKDNGLQMGSADERQDIQGRNDAAARRLPNNRDAMGILEKRTIPGRDGKTPLNPLPFETVPLYFRRAAINAAIAAAKSTLARETEGSRIPEFHQSVTYYKGTYKDLTDHSVTLKVWNGEKWVWTECKLSGNHLPKDAQVMSPSIVVREKRLEFHVPVKEEVTDGRNAKERMAAGEKICAAVFTNEDACVVCSVTEGKAKPAMDETQTVDDGKVSYGPALFIRGGKEYAHKCRQVMEKLEKSKSSTKDDGNAKANQKYWMRIKHLNDSYSHLFSKKVIDFCKEQGAKVLVLPEYKKPYTDMVMAKAGNFSPLHLSFQIREKLKYKAWKTGIIVLEAGEHHTGDRCAICGAKAKRCGKHRIDYICENGHTGNYYLNMARNLGVRCMESFSVQRERLPEKQQAEKIILRDMAKQKRE